MTTISNELNIRKLESENFINCIYRFENENCFNTDLDSLPTINKTQFITSMKASVIIMLYNSVESTMTRCLNKIHETICQDRLNYEQLNDAIKVIILIYYENAMKNSVNSHVIAEHKLKQIEFLKGEVVFNLTYDELAKFYPMYSGNLDARQIKTILKRYGIEFEELCSELKTIKDNRNHLAHGEKSFEEVGRELSLPQLRSLCRKVFEYLETVIQSISEYLTNHSYKIT